MKNKLLLSVLISLYGISAYGADVRYVGGDISCFPDYQKAKYKDENGNSIQLLPYLHEIGMNAMRVRLFVDPAGYTIENGKKEPDSNVSQNLPYIIPLCQQIRDNGFDLMLDFHYSDTWADPAKQYTPDAWKDLTEAELIEKIYDYTKESLLTLQENGITPKFIQPGNEISYGFLWGPYGNVNEGNKVYINSPQSVWKRFITLLESAIKACREVCPEAQIVLHTERVAQVNVLTNFYKNMRAYNLDYDIIGLSYYPYYHGNMSVLDNALTTLETEFPEKNIMIVETGYPYAWEVPGTSQKVDYEYSLAGQDAYAHELVDTLLAHENVDGLFWWWLEYNAYGTQLSGWYNAPLFDSRTGQATPALKTIASFGTDNTGIISIKDDVIPEDGRWYDINGRVIKKPSSPGFYIHNGEKILIK